MLMMFLGLRKLGKICCGHKMFLNKIRNISSSSSSSWSSSSSSSSSQQEILDRAAYQLFMSVTLRNKRRRGLAGMQRDKAPVEWPRSEGGNPTRLRDRCLDGCYENRLQTDELYRKAPSSGRGERAGACHFAFPGVNEPEIGKFSKHG